MRIAFPMLLLACAACAVSETSGAVQREGRSGGMEWRIEWPQPQAEPVLYFIGRRIGSSSDGTAFEEQCRKDAAAMAWEEGRRVVAWPVVQTERIQSSIRTSFWSGALICAVTVPMGNSPIP